MVFADSIPASLIEELADNRPLAIFVWAVIALFIVAGLTVYVARRRLRAYRDKHRYAELKKEKLHIPATLHPIIDPDICIQCMTCVRVCPEGEILGIVDGAVTLIDGSECMGISRCQQECPVGAITLVHGTSERGVDLPESNSVYETSRPGIHVIGELAGMGLIRNALNQGVRVADHFKKTVNRKKGKGVDVVIVGAGPAGLSAAASCSVAGLSHLVLEQGTFGGTVSKYPRHKVVMSETVKLPGYGRFGTKTMSKEDLMEVFRDLAKKTDIQFRERVQVVGVEGNAGEFVVKTTAGDFEGRRVVLATGRQGTPRKLGVPGEAEMTKVTYGLDDPEQYAGKHVLVVGGGDSAIEAACTIAEETNAKVTISYRNEAFARAKKKNKERIADLISSKRLDALMSSEITRIRERDVSLKIKSKNGGPPEKLLPNDYVIAAIGGEVPLEFLNRVGVRVKRFTGQVLGDIRDQQQKGNPALAATLFVIGALILAFMWFVGGDYYLLPKAERLHHRWHEVLKPSGFWGHGVGIVATMFMMLNFMYPVKKRIWSIPLPGRLRTWLTFHTFVGFMAPSVLLFHAAFQSRNLIASVTSVSLVIVVITGVIGRYIWGLIPTARGKSFLREELEAKFEVQKTQLRNLAATTTNPGRVSSASDWVEGANTHTLVAHLAQLPVRRLQARWMLFKMRREFKGQEDRNEFSDAFRSLVDLRSQLAFYESVKKLMSIWRSLHVVMAVLMVFVMVVHIGVSLYLGYTWVFKS